MDKFAEQLIQVDRLEQVRQGDEQLVHWLLLALGKVPEGQADELMQDPLNKYEPFEQDVQLAAPWLQVAHEPLQETHETIPDWLKTKVPFGQRPRH